MLCVFLGCCWKYNLQQFLNQFCAELFVSLKQGSKYLSEGNLQFVLVLILFFEHGNIILIKLVLLFALHILLLILLVILLSIFGLLQEIKYLLTKLLDTELLKKAFSSLLKDLFDRLRLSNQALSLSFGLHSIQNVVGVFLGHLVKRFDVVRVRLLVTLDQAWESAGARDTNVVACVELCESLEYLGDIFDVWSETGAQLVNKNNKHLDGAVFLFDFVSHDVGFLLFVVAKFFKHTLDVCALLLALDLHFWAE